MPTVRSIGNPVPGAPADASGLGGVAPWMSEGQLSQPGQAGLSPGEPHPFASELAAALAAKQGKSETQAASAPKPAQNSGQNLPKQVGTQRDALAKFAEKDPKATDQSQKSSASKSPAELAASEGLNTNAVQTAPAQSADADLKKNEAVEVNRLVEAGLDRDAALEVAAAQAITASQVAAAEAAKVAANASASSAALEAASVAAQEAANAAANASIKLTAIAQAISASVSTTSPGNNNLIASQGVMSDSSPDSGVSSDQLNVIGVPANNLTTSPLLNEGAVTSISNAGVSQVSGTLSQNVNQSSPSIAALNGGTNAAANTSADAAARILAENLTAQNQAQPAQGQNQGQTLGQPEGQAHHQIPSQGMTVNLGSGQPSQPPGLVLPGKNETGFPTPAGAASGDINSLGSKTAAGLVPQAVNTNAVPASNETPTAASAVNETVARIAAQLEADATADVSADALADIATDINDGVLKSGVNKLSVTDTAVLKNAAVQSSAALSSVEQALLKQKANTALANQATDKNLSNGQSQSQLLSQATSQSQLSASSQDLLSQSKGLTSASVAATGAAGSPASASAVAINTAASLAPTGTSALTGTSAPSTSGNAVAAGQVAQQTQASQTTVNQELVKVDATESAISSQQLNAAGVVVDSSGAEQPSASALNQSANLVTQARAIAQNNQSSAAQSSSSSIRTDLAQNTVTETSIEPGSSLASEKAPNTSAPGQSQTTSAARANNSGGVESAQSSNAAVTATTINEEGAHQVSLSQSQALAQESLLTNGNPQTEGQKQGQKQVHIQAQMQLAQSIKSESGSLMASVGSETETTAQSPVGSGIVQSSPMSPASAQASNAVASAQQTSGAVPLSVTTPRPQSADIASAAGLLGQSSDVSQTLTTAPQAVTPSISTPALDSAASPVPTAATKDKNAAALAAERAITGSAETAAVAQTVATVNGSKQESADSKSAANTARLGSSESFDSGIKNAAELASGGEGFDGSNSGDPSDQTSSDSVRLHANVKPGAEFGSVIRSASETASTPAEIARQAAQRVDAASSSAGLSNAEVLSRAENRLEAARASFGSGLLNVEVLRLTRQGGGRAVLEVTPPNEGPIRLDLKLDGAGRATLLVDGLSEAMKTRLEGSSHLLRQDMSQMGLALNLEMRERQESNVFANAMAFGQGQGGESDSASRRGLTQGKSSSIRGGGDAVTSSQPNVAGDGIHFVA
jgi:trimeric autotransporter adhesin